MKEQIIIYRSKKKASFLIVGAVLLSGASYLSFVYAGDQVFGWIFLIAAALLLLLGVSNFSDRKSQLILTQSGITEPFSIREEIEWDAIVGVDDFFYRGQDIVRILIPRSYKPELLRSTWFWRFDRMYARQGVKALYIRVRGLDIKSAQLVTIIENMVKADPDARQAYLQSVKGNFSRR